MTSEPPGIISNSLVLVAKSILKSTFSIRDLKMAKLSKILYHSLFIPSTLAQYASSETETFQVTACNDENDDVS